MSKRHKPRKKPVQSQTPQDAASEKDNAADREVSLVPQVPPTPDNAEKSHNRWYQTLAGWKVMLEIVGIPFAIAYAVVTFFQWRDLRHNFEVDQRAWLKIVLSWPDPITTVPATAKLIFQNTGKSVMTSIYAESSFEIVKSDSPPSFSLKKMHNPTSEASLFPTDASDSSANLFDQVTKTPRRWHTPPPHWSPSRFRARESSGRRAAFRTACGPRPDRYSTDRCR